MSSAFGEVRFTTEGTCPCGGLPAGTTYDDCCGRFHTGAADAPTAEALMRSRYAAFAVGDEGYLLRTWHPRTRPESLRLDPGHLWTGLEILATTAGGVGETNGSVLYRARSRGRGGPDSMTELSRFQRRAGRWVYVDGDITE